MTDSFSQLQKFSWRGIEVPLLSRRASFSHQEVTHQIQYSSGEIIEITLKNNWRFDYTIPFREDIVKGGYGLLFSQTFALFLAAFENGEPGTLVDPVLGSKKARPLMFTDVSDVNRRDGDDVDVSFVEHKTTKDLENQVDKDPSIEAIIIDSRSIDSQIATQSWGGDPPTQISSDLVNWEQELPPEPTINPIDAVAGIFRQVERVNQKSKAVYQDTSRRLGALEDSISSSSDAAFKWPIYANARTLRLQVLRAESRERARRRPLRRSTLPMVMTPMDAAGIFGLSLTQFLELNPSLKNSTSIEQGTIITHFR